MIIGYIQFMKTQYQGLLLNTTCITSWNLRCTALDNHMGEWEFGFKQDAFEGPLEHPGRTHRRDLIRDKIYGRIF